MARQSIAVPQAPAERVDAPAPSVRRPRSPRRNLTPYLLVAPTAVFLASDDSTYYVGQTLGPNGGDVML